MLYAWKARHLDDMEAQTPEGTQSPKELAAENAELLKRLAKSARMNEILEKNSATPATPSDALPQYR